MAELIENSKGFKVIKVTREEIANKLDSPGFCDNCLGKPNTGYLVVVLDHWLCPNCYAHWYQVAQRYSEDEEIEEKRFQYYKQLFLNND